MGLAANDSHLWNMCGAAEWGRLRQDINKAWILQPGCTHRLSRAAARLVLVQASGGIGGSPEFKPFGADNALTKMALLGKLLARMIERGQ